MTKTCTCCSYTMTLSVLISGSGAFYIGYACPDCGPYERVSSEYFKSYSEANEALLTGNFTRRDHP